MKYSLTETELRIIYLGREMRALAAAEPNETVSMHLADLGNKLTSINDGIDISDFDEFELELMQAVASESFSGVEV